MNLTQRFLACAFIGIVFMTYSCSNNSSGDPVGCNYVTEVNDELTALNDAINVWVMDPSTDNCIAYVNAFQDYLNALEDHVDCATLYGNQAELQTAINEAQANLNNIQC